MKTSPPCRLAAVEAVSFLDDTHPPRWVGRLPLPCASRPTDIMIFQLPGEFRALSVRCPHEGRDLTRCPLHGDILVCPGHGLRIDLHVSGFPAMKEDGRFLIPLTENGACWPGEGRGDRVAEAEASETIGQMQEEIEKLRLANLKQERQILAITRSMDAMLSESEQQREKLKEAASRQQALNRFVHRMLDTLDDLLLVIDTEGRIRRTNTAVERQLGCAEAELMATPIDDLLWPAERQHLAALLPPVPWPVRSVLLETTRRNGIYSGEHVLLARHRDGVRPVYWLKSALLHTEQGKLEGAVVTAANITEHKRAEQALRASEEGFRLLVDGVKDYAIFMMDVEGRVMSWNAGAEAIKGYRAEEVLGRPLSIFYPEDQQRAGVPEQHLRITRELGRYEDDMVRVRKDGSRFWAGVVLTALRDEQGRLQGYAMITRDITERKRGQESMARALEEKTTLLNEVHHRVKNNLQVISSLFNLQAAHTRDAGVIQVLAESQGRVRAMALIHQLLYESHDFSRIHLGSYLEKLGQLLVTLHNAKANRIVVKTHVGGEPVYLDLHRAIPCGLLVTELITNAFKHAFPGGGGGEVRITLARPIPEEARLTVSDTGVGLPPGFQLGQSASLGLRLVQRLVEQVKGRLLVGEGPGASFLLYFKPLEEGEEP